MTLLDIPTDVGRLIVEWLSELDVARLQQVCRRTKLYGDGRMVQLRMSLPSRREVLQWMQRQFEGFEHVHVVWYKSNSVVMTEVSRLHHPHTYNGNVSIYYLSEVGRMTTTAWCISLSQWHNDRDEENAPRTALERAIPEGSVADPQTLLSVMKERRCCKDNTYGLDVVRSLVSMWMDTRVDVADNAIRTKRIDIYRRVRDELRIVMTWALSLTRHDVESYGYAYNHYDDEDPDGDMQKSDEQLFRDLDATLIAWRNSWCNQVDSSLRYLDVKEVLPYDEEICKWIERRLVMQQTTRFSLYQHIEMTKMLRVIEIEFVAGTVLYRCYKSRKESDELDVMMTEMPETCLVEVMLRDRRVNGLIDPTTALTIMRARSNVCTKDYGTPRVMRYIKKQLIEHMKPFVDSQLVLFGSHSEAERSICAASCAYSYFNAKHLRTLYLLMFWMNRCVNNERGRILHEKVWMDGSKYAVLVKSMLWKARVACVNVGD